MKNNDSVHEALAKEIMGHRKYCLEVAREVLRDGSTSNLRKILNKMNGIQPTQTAPGFNSTVRKKSQLNAMKNRTPITMG